MRRRTATIGAGVAVVAAAAAILFGSSTGGSIDVIIGGTPTPSTTPGPSCNQTTSAASLAALNTAIAAASAGQTVCLGQTGSYGTWTGTTKAITITPSAGVNPTIALAFTTTVGNFTVDGGRSTWDDSTGLSITGADFTGTGVHDVTIKNSYITGTGVGGVVEIDGPNPPAHLTFDHNVFHDITKPTEAAIRISYNPPGNADITIERNLFRDNHADGVKYGSGAVRILNNKFLRITDNNDPDIHSDAIQLFSGEDSVIRGNWVDTCDQAISGFDGMDNALISHNVVVHCTNHWFTQQYDGYVGHASTVEFDTIGDADGADNCTTQTKTGYQASITKIRNNVARSIILDDGPGGNITCTPTQDTNNLVNSGATAGNINGTPLFVGGSSPTTFAGFCLTSSSPGFTGATDGTQVGLCGGDYNSATDGPPVGEGF